MKIKVKNSGIVKLATQKDARRGDLFIAETSRHIPFPVRRLYFINNFKRSGRGGHAHKTTNQVIFCANGSFTLHLDDGKNKQKVMLNDPSVGVILGPKLWHSMSDFSKNCVALVCADAPYDKNDYVSEYKDFIRLS